MSCLIIGNAINIISQDSTTIGGLSTVTLATLTRTGEKTPIGECFITNNVAGASANDSTSATIRLTTPRTTTDGEYNVVASNSSTSSKTIDWKVYEI
jgi:hypothetical protein